MKSLSTQGFTAYVGIDWADTHHDICLQVAGGDQLSFDRIDHRPDCIERWAHSIRQTYGGVIAIALELSKGPLVAALQKYDFFVLFPIHPTTLARYRSPFVPSGAKDDPTDAQWALELLLRHPDKFAPLQPQSPSMRSLVSLTEHRRYLVEDKVRVSNRLCGNLKQYGLAPAKPDTNSPLN